MRTILVILCLLLTSTAHAAVECVTVNTTGWSQTRINHLPGIAYSIYYQATSRNIVPTVSPARVVCFPGSTVDVPPIITPAALLQRWNADEAARAASTQQEAADDAAYRQAVIDNCVAILTDTNAYYNNAFPLGLPPTATQARAEFKKLANCLKLTQSRRFNPQ